MRENILYISRAGYQKLLDKLQDILGERRYSEQEMGESALADPDLRENPYFMNTRTKLEGEIPRRILETKEKIKTAAIIEEQPFFQTNRLDEAFIGSKVTVTNDFGETYSFTILSPVEANPQENIISYLSPVGVALLGKRLEEAIEVNTPDGRQSLRINKIERGI